MRSLYSRVNFEEGSLNFLFCQYITVGKYSAICTVNEHLEKQKDVAYGSWYETFRLAMFF